MLAEIERDETDFKKMFKPNLSMNAITLIHEFYMNLMDIECSTFLNSSQIAVDQISPIGFLQGLMKSSGLLSLSKLTAL